MGKNVTVKGVCVDCPEEVRRVVTPPGPRCRTHHQSRKDREHDLRVQRTYGMLPGEYAKLYAYQGGLCWGCRRATGRTRRLAVDHDHRAPCIVRGDHPKDRGCRECIRGLLCSTCNNVIGYYRDDPETLERLRGYLVEPPYRVFKERSNDAVTRI